MKKDHEICKTNFEHVKRFTAGVIIKQGLHSLNHPAMLTAMEEFEMEKRIRNNRKKKQEKEVAYLEKKSEGHSQQKR